MTGTPREKIVVRDAGNGTTEAITRARLLGKPRMRDASSVQDGDLTDIGATALSHLDGADGVELLSVLRHGVTFRTIHPELWPKDEVETAVVAAFSAAHGVQYQVVRDNQTETRS